jgi:hypothetical protein
MKKYDLIYEPKSVCYHMKKDTVMSLVKAYYGWTFYGYPIPNNLNRFLYRFFIANPYKAATLIIKDIINLNLLNIPLDIFVGVMHTLFDFRYLVKNE